MKRSNDFIVCMLCSLALLVTSTAQAQWQQIDVEGAPGAAASFGNAVAIDRDLALIGDPGLDFDQGAAYVFRRNSNNNWTHEATLASPNGGKFGISVDLYVTSSTCRAIVGAGDDNAAAIFGGAAYIYECDDWSNPVQLTASDVQLSDRFGASVSIDGNRALVGAPGHDGGAQQCRSRLHVFPHRQWLDPRAETDREQPVPGG